MNVVRTISVALAVLLASGSFSSCPLANGFFIRVENGGTDIAVTVVRLRDFNAQTNVSDNLLPEAVDGGSQRMLFVPLRDVGTAEALRIRVDGTNPGQPIGFAVTRVIAGGFAAGKTVTVAVAGSPTQSISIEVGTDE